jgi:hypothetical protein
MKSFYASCGALIVGILLAAPVHAGPTHPRQRAGQRSIQRPNQRMSPRMNQRPNQRTNQRMNPRSNQLAGQRSSQRPGQRSTRHLGRHGGTLLLPEQQLSSQWPPQQSQNLEANNQDSGDAPNVESQGPDAQTDDPNTPTDDTNAATDDTNTPTDDTNAATGDPSSRGYQPGRQPGKGSPAQPAVNPEVGRRRQHSLSNGSPRLPGSRSQRGSKTETRDTPNPGQPTRAQSTRSHNKRM